MAQRLLQALRGSFWLGPLRRSCRYAKGLECDPYDEGLKVGLAEAQSATSEPERKALAQKEKDLGNSAYMMKDFYTAIAHYTKAIELSDEDISFLLDRALTYLKMGQV